MLGGVPDEIYVDKRADGDYNVDFYFRAEKIEYRLVLSHDQLGRMVYDGSQELGK